MLRWEENARADRKRRRAGWCVWKSAAGVERLLCDSLTEASARGMVSRLNARLNEGEGTPTAAPFDFYFCHHGNFVSSPRDAGLDQWIDEGADMLDVTGSVQRAKSKLRRQGAVCPAATKDGMMSKTYEAFLAGKSQLGDRHGFEPLWMPDCLSGDFAFQGHLTSWAIRRGRAALFADTGLGKTIMQLVWAENVVKKTNRPVLILTPLAVGRQTVAEAQRFGIDAVRCPDGKIPAGALILVTNYQRLHYFDPADFAGVVCDESSVLKNFDGKTRAAVTEFLRTLPYRLLCTATAAPNDEFELGTSSEALGELGHQDMLGRFFRQQLAARGTVGWGHDTFVLRKHAERDFWRWVCSWARAVRKPSDLGFDDGPFLLPPLTTREHSVSVMQKAPGFLFSLPAVTMSEQRDEERRSVRERCEKAAELSTGKDPAVCWCFRNDEADLLESLIPDAAQVSGSDSDEAKEEKLVAFASGQVRVMVTKPKIAGYGLNWQHCNQQVFFPSHSFESYYQAVRRCWRFGQKRPVTVDIVTTEGVAGVMDNLRRKSEAADRMFSRLVELMNQSLSIERPNPSTKNTEVPSWLQAS